MAEFLGRYVEKMVTLGEFVGLGPSFKNLTFSRQRFLDDSIVMGEASVRNARNIKKALEDYGQASGQIINWNKSVIDRKSTRLNSSHSDRSRMPSSA